jgi:hypothetical protein
MSATKTRIDETVKTQQDEVKKPITFSEVSPDFDISKIVAKVQKILSGLDNSIIDMEKIKLCDLLIRNTDEYLLIHKYRNDIEKENEKRTGKIYKNVIKKNIFKF